MTYFKITFYLIIALCMNAGFGQSDFESKKIRSPFIQDNGNFGYNAAIIGDVNNDGKKDFIISSIVENAAIDPSGAGLAHIFTNMGDSVLYTVKSPSPEENGWFGYDVADGGDINNDGFDDFIVSARRENPDGHHALAGRVYVFSGNDGSVIFTLKSPNPTNDGMFGVSIDGNADINKDGYPDILVGAQEEENASGSLAHAGRAYIFSGIDGSLMLDLKAPEEVLNGKFGHDVRFAGDLNSDDVDEILISQFGARKVILFNGADTSVIKEFTSPNDGVGFGLKIGYTLDTNKDFVPDILISAAYENPDGSHDQAGRVYLFSGENYSLLQTFVSPNMEAYGYFGISVDIVGDADGDGNVDVLIGSYEQNYYGRAYLLNCSDGSLVETFETNSGVNYGEYSSHVAGLGDMDNDDYPEFLISSRRESFNAISGSGVVYFYNFNKVSSIGSIGNIPDKFLLDQNYPNPFNPITAIGYRLPAASDVELGIYNLLGQKVATLVNARQAAGNYQVQWDASGFPSGVYLYRLITGSGFTETKKLLLLK